MLSNTTAPVDVEATAEEVPVGVDEARAALVDLQAEQAALPAELEAAERNIDAVRWMRCTTRGRDLPEEIERARLTFLPLALTEAWEAAEAAHRDELTAADTLHERSQALIAARSVRPDPLLSPADQLRRNGEIAAVAAEAADAAQNAYKAHRAALMRTCRALHQVESIEIAMRAAALPVDEVEQGFRALPQSANGNVMLTADTLGDLAEALRGDSRLKLHIGVDERWLLSVGTVPPRWIAHFVGHVHYNPRAGLPSEHELEMQRRHAENQRSLENRPCGRPDVGMQTKKVWVIA